ncbi:hypothetical protein L9G15_01300 [Shewanella sp. A3A]|nr:hypothetical protein [Shewanella ferrihydritica]
MAVTVNITPPKLSIAMHRTIVLRQRESIATGWHFGDIMAGIMLTLLEYTFYQIVRR